MTQTAADLKAYGLDRPELTVKVTSEGKTQTLLVGKSVEGTRYPKRAEDTSVFTVKDASVFATREGEPSAATITRTAYDEALKALDGLK